MAVYNVKVSTGDRAYAGTSDYLYITLIGAKGESQRTLLDNWGKDLTRGKTRSYSVQSSQPVGDLLLLKVEMDPLLLLPEDQWFCSKIVVTTPEGDVVLFPCHQWVSRGDVVELRGGPALKLFEETHPVLLEHRRKELELRKQVYQYTTLAEGLPKFNSFKEITDIPTSISGSTPKKEKVFSATERKLKRLNNSTKDWKDLEDLKSVFRFRSSPLYEHSMEHWKDDDFYGFQFLNGVNPNVIRCCSQLPAHFPVTEQMVKPFLQEGSSLHMEMEKGNMFLCDYKTLDGIPCRDYNGEKLTVAAGLCLLYKNPKDELRPIAIQLQQQPSEENPIFLPSDGETDWLLAKLFIKNSDSIQHQSVHHLLNTHLVVQGFALATLRNLPSIHPLYKLLIPHFRNTIHVNTLALSDIRSEDGFFNQSTIGMAGSLKLMARAHAETTYSSLFLPENIAARGLQSVPNFYYRDDGLKLWHIVQSFAKEMVDIYYPSDNDVSRDSELQDWIDDIYTNTFLENGRSGIPQEFLKVEELAKFVTMVIFTASAKHAAVHNGQFDYIGWIPNNPMMLCRPPPSTKGRSSMETLLETLPNQATTAKLLSPICNVCQEVEDLVPLGSYPERFGEPLSRLNLAAFQGDLAYLSEEITKRNSELLLPYEYLNPAQIENSVVS
ncbi:hydroperoxide isomerase ALOXE3-like isoform X1 [Gadus macrocephalus]|uniref:hydroperoxide isomerase ALOXE3-like isoform X1 n=1 Tax=Gadus macrocephalus TaxID=80720 RepID=UPI0028CBB264|nr:hydroperoxide isomerase ALOXE3-like isoform X1 [Gadus macrocephalus]